MKYAKDPSIKKLKKLKRKFREKDRKRVIREIELGLLPIKYKPAIRLHPKQVIIGVEHSTGRLVLKKAPTNPKIIPRLTVSYICRNNDLLRSHDYIPHTSKKALKRKLHREFCKDLYLGKKTERDGMNYKEYKKLYKKTLNVVSLLKSI